MVLVAGQLINPDKIFADNLDKEIMGSLSDYAYVNLGFSPDNVLFSDEKSQEGKSFGFSINIIQFSHVHFKDVNYYGYYYIPAIEFELRFLKNLMNSPEVDWMLVLDIIVFPGRLFNYNLGASVHLTFNFVKTLEKTDKGNFWMNLAWGPGVITDFYAYRYWDDPHNEWAYAPAPVFAAMGFFGPEFYFLSGKMSVFTYVGVAVGFSNSPYYASDHFYRTGFLKLGIKFHLKE